MPTNSSYFIDRRECVRLIIAGDVYKRCYTSPVMYGRNVTIYVTDLDIIQYFRGTHRSLKTGLFRRHEATMIALDHADIYSLAIFWTARDVCAERVPVMYLSACMRPR